MALALQVLVTAADAPLAQRVPQVSLLEREQALRMELFERQLDAQNVSVFLPVMGMLAGGFFVAVSYPLRSVEFWALGIATGGLSLTWLIFQIVRKVRLGREVDRIHTELLAVQYARAAR